jgi:tRNA threonylcarbamoyl adenosine modification protein YeaZ
MKLLAIETSTPGSSVAVVEDRRTLAAASRIDRMGHAGFLVPAIDFCFDQVGWSPDVLDAVVVDVGPGLYTGIRVGLSTAQGLAAAFGIPIIPAVSVDALALEAKTGHRMIWAIVDARRRLCRLISGNRDSGNRSHTSRKSQIPPWVVLSGLFSGLGSGLVGFSRWDRLRVDPALRGPTLADQKQDEA